MSDHLCLGFRFQVKAASLVNLKELLLSFIIFWCNSVTKTVFCESDKFQLWNIFDVDCFIRIFIEMPQKYYCSCK